MLSLACSHSNLRDKTFGWKFDEVLRNLGLSAYCLQEVYNHWAYKNLGRLHFNNYSFFDRVASRYTLFASRYTVSSECVSPLSLPHPSTSLYLCFALSCIYVYSIKYALMYPVSISCLQYKKCIDISVYMCIVTY